MNRFCPLWSVPLLTSALLLTGLAPPGTQGTVRRGPRPRLQSARDLLPHVVELISVPAIAASSDRHAPWFASIALGKDEYVYSLLDKVFIRSIKNRYELPAWHICGDWASVRIELLGESMETVTPVMVWFLAYRDGQWARVIQDEDGRFFRAGEKAEMPPYVVRCFNLDKKELTDQ